MSDDRPGPFPDERNEADSPAGAHSGSEDRDAPDELELGEALGRTLRERPETAWTTPPVSLIAERAAARAKARAARRTVAGIAAAAALIIGGVAVWNGLDGDGTGTVVVSPDDPDATDPDGAGLDTAAADGTGASASSSAEADGPVAGTAADDPTTSSDPPAVEDGQPSSPDKPTPEQLSTGPVLQWTEIDPGFVDLYLLESVGDGRVLARGRRNAGSIENPSTVDQVVVTTNGVDWIDVPMPAGIAPQFVDISGDRWVVTGDGRLSDAGGIWTGSVTAGLGRAFFSDDEGATWTELTLDLPRRPAWASPYVVEDSRVAGVLVSGNNIVLVVVRDTGLELSALLEGRDLVPEGRLVVGWSTRLESIVFDLAESLQPGESGPPRLIAHGAGAGGVGGGGWGPPVESISLTYDELGLTDEERAVLDDPGYDRTLLLTGDGYVMEAVAEYEGRLVAGSAIAEGFFLRVIGPGAAVVTSPDGRLWSEHPSPEFWPSPWSAMSLAGGTIWYEATDQYGVLTVRRGRYGEAAMPVATFEGLQPAGRLAVGPAGVVATAHPSPDDAGSEAIDSVLPEGRIAKDGYELRYNEPEGGVTLWDLEAGAAVYVFGPEDRQVDQPPAGVRESSEDGEFALVFEDPETGADLVTFTYEDLAPVFEATSDSDSATVSVDPEDYEMPETWVGWSADGSAWGWQTMADAFGIDNASAGSEFAVGSDFVIARVDATQVEVAVSTNAQGDYAYASAQSSVGLQARWFIARVP